MFNRVRAHEVVSKQPEEDNGKIVRMYPPSLVQAFVGNIPKIGYGKVEPGHA